MSTVVVFLRCEKVKFRFVTDFDHFNSVHVHALLSMSTCNRNWYSLQNNGNKNTKKDSVWLQHNVHALSFDIVAKW